MLGHEACQLCAFLQEALLGSGQQTLPECQPLIRHRRPSRRQLQNAEIHQVRDWAAE